MLTKTLLMGLAAFTLFYAPMSALLSVPALAQSTATSGKTGGTTTISKSDENFLSQLSDKDFNQVTGGSNPLDKDGDGIADSPVTMEDLNRAVTPKRPGDDAAKEEEAKKNVKYVYNPQSDTTLRRTLVDPRLGDDGYVQGLMKQRGPQ